MSAWLQKSGAYLATAAVVALMAVIVVFGVMSEAKDPWHSGGRGPGWECQHYGVGVSYCAKDVPIAPRPGQQHRDELSAGK
ncbi:MAG TPA: hypothetical protein VGI79_00010 [Caulobacteraceae bacterium]|jgi:hypothetical protein